MELVQALQELAPAIMAARAQLQCRAGDEGETSCSEAADSGVGRRWIWAHHIKDAGRRKDITKEARDLALGGYLKGGYPGIVVVEGETHACNEFVSWVKGNKSRPGGFGRNWGHHVRGEISLPAGARRRLPATFEELEEDMGALGAACARHGLEEEFLQYVLQHKVSGDGAEPEPEPRGGGGGARRRRQRRRRSGRALRHAPCRAAWSRR